MAGWFQDVHVVGEAIQQHDEWSEGRRYLTFTDRLDTET